MTLTHGKTHLITGASGFIGYHLCKRLLAQGEQVIGIDNMNDYYDVRLKQTRLAELRAYERYIFAQMDVAEKSELMALFAKHRPQVVVHLAAQAGVRYSIDHPDTYISSNLVGFFNMLEACRHYPVEHLVYASSSSVYGANEKVPFAEADVVDHPVSLYAATKKSNELMAHTYAHLYNIPATGLRFFTVYGPLGRPDMAYYHFADAYFAGKPISIYNDGDLANDLYRDFTYVDDVVEGIERVLARPPLRGGDACGSGAGARSRGNRAPHVVYNIGNNRPEKLMDFIETLEQALGRALGRPVVFAKTFEAIKPGDVPATYASTELLEQAVGFKPKTSIADGLQRFADWYVEYHQLK